MEIKRPVSVLIPYKVVDGEVFAYLQKREQHRKILPGCFSFFGGKVEEGETSQMGLEREISEELCFTPKNYQFLKKYEFATCITDVYYLRVTDSFEREVTVTEGEYGKFLSEKEVLVEPTIIEEDKGILKDLYVVVRGLV